MVTSGAVCLSFAFLLLGIEHLFSRSSNTYFYLDAVGMSFSIGGIFLMVLGLRSHYLVWTRKVSNKAPQQPILLNEKKDIER